MYVPQSHHERRLQTPWVCISAFMLTDGWYPLLGAILLHYVLAHHFPSLHSMYLWWSLTKDIVHAKKCCHTPQLKCCCLTNRPRPQNELLGSARGGGGEWMQCPCTNEGVKMIRQNNLWSCCWSPQRLKSSKHVPLVLKLMHFQVVGFDGLGQTTSKVHGMRKHVLCTTILH